MSEKIIRSLCFFLEDFHSGIEEKIKRVEKKLLNHNFTIQTKRFCFKDKSVEYVNSLPLDKEYYLSIGSLDQKRTDVEFSDFMKAHNVSFNLSLKDQVTNKDVEFLFKLIRDKPEKTFNFAYTFNNAHSSPYFPSAHFKRPGFSVGLQPCDLAEGCLTPDEWFKKLKLAWKEIIQLLKTEKQFLGIDSSVAPLFNNNSSFIHFIKRVHKCFNNSIVSETYIDISNFIKNMNPKPVGLCGLMFPCLEDFELAEEYERGEFTIERNIFLSLHSGLGIDTYPIGINESHKRILGILRLIKKLSDKYKKPLSVRFISDGKASIGEKSSFGNPYLKDVVIRKL